MRERRSHARLGTALAAALAVGGWSAALAAGQPCPQPPPEAFTAWLKATRLLPTHHFGFGGVRFSRAAGRADCRIVHEGAAAVPVCRFSAPAVLQVSTASGRYGFLPGSGPATVSVRGGRPFCVMGG